MLSVPCTVRNWSETGVKIELPPQTALPRRFWLIDHRFALTHEARLVWRDENFAGLELLAPRELAPEGNPLLRFLRGIWAAKPAR
ncbi:MAG TPA: hypothetical protein VII63_09300 [Caulobacteraceae bacterium]